MSSGDLSAYDLHRVAAANRSRQQVKTGQNCGPIPAVVNRERRDACRLDLRLFLETYFPEAFPLAWSPDHLEAIERLQRATLFGGLFAFAMPRGSGKTTIAERVAIWALIFGHVPFACLVGATEPAAKSTLDSIKVELQFNDLLYEDFPEVCHPIRELDNEPRRCRGQHVDGENTRIVWTDHKLILPTVAGSVASGGIVTVCGITGAIRGQKHTRPDGTIVRPSLVLIDDPQTRESAASVTQSATREAIIAGDVLGMSGPGKKIAAVMPCTVIHQGDAADNLLSREKHPQWQGQRTKMVLEWPVRQDLWDRYAELRMDSFRADGDGREATEFYREHQSEMDAGAVVAWPERKNEDELSAIQHAWNLRLRDENAFFAEYQNEPRSKSEVGVELLSAEEICQRQGGHLRGEIFLSATRLTAFVDVQKSALFWMVTAWADDFTGQIVDYGCYPKQSAAYFSLASLRDTLQTVHAGMGLEAQIHAALAALTGQLLGKEWQRDDGARLRIERLLIDANWGESTDTVYSFCRSSPHAASITPSHGKFVGASSQPFSQYKKKRGDRVGFNWRQPNIRGTRLVRHVLYDTNAFKSFVHARLATAPGDSGSLTLFKDNPQAHRLLADHLLAEYRVKTEGRGREVDEWKLRPERPDNHWLDCLAGCAVGASMQGCSLRGVEVVQQGPPKKTMTFAEARELHRKRKR